MQRRPLDHILRIALQIDEGIKNHETRQAVFAPLWDHPLLLENFIMMLQEDSDDHRINFEIIANLLNPPFLETAKRLCADSRSMPFAAD